MSKTVKLSTIENSNTFEVAGIEFIKFSEDNGSVTAVAKKSVFCSIVGKTNNFKKSDILKKLKDEILPKIIAAVGEENVLEFDTDLLALDGTDDYGTLTSKISIPTLDFFRANKKVFDKHGYDMYTWLSTPDSTRNSWNLCVSPSGSIFNFSCYGPNFGVRPSLRFSSSISVSCRD